jgi:DNA-3-methyladenine glycosylase I
VNSAVTNAQNFIKIQEEFETFSNYLWSFVDGKPIKNGFKSMREAPANTALSDKISKDLKKRGFKFVGTTVIYAYLQATGIVNDHATYCYRYSEV